MRKYLSCIMIAYLLVSCAYTNYLYIDVRKPASVTFPNNVQNIALINNATETSTDSAEYILIGALGQFIDESNVFAQVDIHDSFQSDKLTKEEMRAICETNNSEAAILLNYFNIFPKKESTEFRISGTDIYADTLKILIHASFDIYLRERESSSRTINVVDSIFWDEVRTKEESLSDPIPPESEILRETAIYIATKAEKTFTPYWDQQIRWYHVNGTTLMKEADIYAKSNNWDKALENWSILFDSEKNSGKKAKLASNIALAYEMMDDVETAYEWIEKAENLLPNDENNKKNDDLEKIRLYKSELERRLQDFNLLDLQEN